MELLKSKCVQLLLTYLFYTCLMHHVLVCLQMQTFQSYLQEAYTHLCKAINDAVCE